MAKPVNQAQMRKFQKIPSSNSDHWWSPQIFSLTLWTPRPANRWCTSCLDWVEDEDLHSVSLISHLPSQITSTTSKLPAILSQCRMSPLPWSMTNPGRENASEWGNNVLNTNRAFKAAHPSLWTFLTKLRKFHAEVETKYLQVAVGTTPSQPVPKKWRIREGRLKHLADNYKPS